MHADTSCGRFNTETLQHEATRSVFTITIACRPRQAGNVRVGNDRPLLLLPKGSMSIN